MSVSGDMLKAFAAWAKEGEVEDPAPAEVKPEAAAPAEPAPAAPEPAPAAESPAPAAEEPKSLKAVLGYLLTLAKAAKDKGDKLDDAEVRSLAVQANNILRELVLGAGAAPLESGDGDMTDEEAISLVREYELLSEKISKNGANEKDKAAFLALGEQIKMLISKTAKI